MKKIIIKVAGMTCNNCEKRITASLEIIKGIKNVNASFSHGSVEIVIDSDKISEHLLKQTINDLGYKYKGITDSDVKEISRTKIKQILPIFMSILIIYFIIGSIVGFNFINFIPSINKDIPLLMLFVIGLLTSIHCIGMCGSINLAVCVGNSDSKSIKKPLLYNLGRVISYTITGAIVGGLGSVISFNGNLQGIVILIAAIFMLMMGLAMLGWLPSNLYKYLPKLPNIFKNNNSKKNTPLIAGLLNGLMPCGPLQAMQLYALSTGSILTGALSMFLFSLGTVPLVFGFGLLFSSLKGKYNIIIQRISSILIIILSLFMMNRALTLWGIDINKSVKEIVIKQTYKNYVVATIKDGKQYVEINLKPSGYTPIVVQKGIPVEFNIKVDDIRYYGCTNAIRIPSLDISKELNTGNNIVEFTPQKICDITYTCWMGMVTSNIKVVDNLEKIGTITKGKPVVTNIIK